MRVRRTVLLTFAAAAQAFRPAPLPRLPAPAARVLRVSRRSVGVALAPSASGGGGAVVRRRSVVERVRVAGLFVRYYAAPLRLCGSVKA